MQTLATLGILDRLMPVSRSFGFDRGTPVDRHLLERFLSEHRTDIHGRTLEIGDDHYTSHFGGDRTEQRDILHVHAGNSRATIVGDLAQPAVLPADAFDCAVITQTLHLIYDLQTAFDSLYRSLKRGGVLLATVPAVSQISEDEWTKTWFWGFTPASLRQVASAVFAGTADRVDVTCYGAPPTTIAFLHGIAAEELRAPLLERDDPDRPTLLCLRAVRG